MEINDKVYKFIKSNKMINKGERILVALSGGPDSICLLHILYKIMDKFGIKLYAAHLNHCIRGEEADKDEEYCRKFCENLGISFFSKKVDVELLAKTERISCEVSGRNARYNFFDEIKKEFGINKIAIAHNSNDQAETILLRLIRGAGIDGLCGIRAVRDDIYIRPILGLHREDIEKYCDDNNLQPRIDKTNLQNIYTRNKVRLDLIPYIAENFNSDIIGTLNRLAYTMQGEQSLLKEYVDMHYKKFCIKDDNKVIIKKDAFLEGENLIARLIRQGYYDICGNLNDLEKVNIYDVINLSKGQTGKFIMLPNGIVAYNDYGDIYIIYGENNVSSEKNDDKAIEMIIHELKIDEINIVDNMNISLSIVKNEKVKLDTNNVYKKYFNYDKIKSSINLRYRREQDFFYPLGMSGKKTLKKLFIDMKISRYDRDRIPLVCFGNDIAWVVGYKVSERYKVTEDTKKILCINFERGIVK